jgi:hypothetical protein
MVVVAGGTAYVVDPETRQLLHRLRHEIDWAFSDEARGQLVFGDRRGFEALSSGGLRWRSRNISVDRMRSVTLAGSRITGEVLGSPDDHWIPFSVDLETGVATGGLSLIDVPVRDAE